RMMRHLGPTLLCAWIVWAADGVNNKTSGGWHIKAAFPVYTACVQAARSMAIEQAQLMAKDGGDAGWGPVRGDDRSGQYAATMTLRNGETVQTYFHCFPDTVKNPNP